MLESGNFYWHAKNKDFFNEKTNAKDVKAISLKSILTQTDTLDISDYLRTPITMKQLIKFSEDDLDNYYVYTKSRIETIDAKTVFYIDNAVEVDDSDNELYPPFVQENDLCVYFLGSQAVDIIGNTRYQLCQKIPNVSDYIKNFNNYSKNDCYYNFRTFTPNHTDRHKTPPVRPHDTLVPLP